MRMRLLTATLLAVSACAGSEEDRPGELVSDLVAELAAAEVRAEPGRIDLGTAAGRRFLGEGWSWNETGEDGKSFVWATRSGSELWFFLERPRRLAIEIRCLPLRRPQGSVEALVVYADEHPVADIPLQRGWREYAFEIPPASLRAGDNRLRFEYRWSVASSEAMPAGGGRPVALAWDWIRFSDADGSLPSALADSAQLVLTPHSRVDFFLALPAGSALTIDSIASTGSDDGRLELSILFDDGRTGSRRMLDRSNSGRPLRWELTSVAGLARLRLVSTGRFVLERPRVIAPEGPRDRSPDRPPEADPHGAWQEPANRPPLVLLYLIDTLRADHLGSFGYGRDTTPVIDRWLEDAVLFTEALASSSWTKPSVGSLLTGRQPWTHGAEGDRDVLADDLTAMAEHFRRLGYRTGGFSTNGYISPRFGFDRGFDHFALMPEFDTPSDRVQETALEWLDAQPAGEPIFLYIQTIDPHVPYAPAARQRQRFVRGDPDAEVGSIAFMRELAQDRHPPEAELLRDLVDLYDAEIAYNDQQFGDLLAALDERRLYDEALIVLLSDHGEEFWDHGDWTHSRTLHREVLRVPFAIRFPGDRSGGRRIEATVQLIDLLPTLLDLFQLPIPPELPGRSLLPLLGDRPPATPAERSRPASRPLFASLHHHSHHWASVRLDGWKLLVRGPDRIDRRVQLFDLDRDPLELEDLADHHPVRVGYLVSLLRRELARVPAGRQTERVELDEATVERLQALGYLE